ncbi:MAG: VWA domain-containing protein [Reyranellaceae bacterium]
MGAEDRKSSIPAPRGALSREVDRFLDRARRVPAVASDASTARGRLLFCMDATASREPTWDQARRIQGDMFVAAEKLGGLAVRLAFYRGFDEFKASEWVTGGVELARLMSRVDCLAGHTQIARSLALAVDEASTSRLHAMVLVGDAFEEEIESVGPGAGKLGLLGVPVFAFQEGRDPAASRAFRQIARLSGGRHCAFDSASPDELRRLLGAVAAYASGGAAAMNEYARLHGGAARRLLDQRG